MFIIQVMLKYVTLNEVTTKLPKLPKSQKVAQHVPSLKSMNQINIIKCHINNCTITNSDVRIFRSDFRRELDGSGTKDVRNVLFSGKGVGGQEEGVWTFEVDRTGTGVILQPMTNETKAPTKTKSNEQFYAGATQSAN